MKNYVNAGGLEIAPALYDLVQEEIIPGTDVLVEDFWGGLEEIVRTLGPNNRQLLDRRDSLQRQIDAWHKTHSIESIDCTDYAAFLKDIGYLSPEIENFKIDTTNVDLEISILSGPQLVVPLDNARYALNAANARWGSLYDALYGTDVIPETDGAEKRAVYNPVRGSRVVAYTEVFLDEHFPLNVGLYEHVIRYAIDEYEGRQRLVVDLENGERSWLKESSQFIGFQETQDELSAVLMCHHGLHVEIQVDRSHPIGSGHRAGVKDVILESAVTTIQDCEDSVSAVDADDKVCVYRNWFGIMGGTLQTNLKKNGQDVIRKLEADREFLGTNRKAFSLSGRSLLLIRHVGIHMYTDVVKLNGEPIPEGFLDAMVTSLAALHDIKGLGQYRNSKTGSIYIVKPKLHGPEEVSATTDLFSCVEKVLGLEPLTLKIGIMDEERRTTVNLDACICEARQRVVFINTGFLDRTGDEIHTSMLAGPMIPKMEIKDAVWMKAYEDWNVDAGISSGLPGKAQIGKGMWTMPDLMRTMIEKKIEHPRAGASTAWVPSPTAATLHALHYHEVSVAQVQADLLGRSRPQLGEILTPPLLAPRVLNQEEIQNELDNNAQGILGYVVRWVDQGVGCSKVLDVEDMGLMEDRATLRISSQHIANWLFHDIVTEGQVRETFRKMAAVVDRQNSGDSAYTPMLPDCDRSVAFQAALELVLNGRDEPNGYTERVLTVRRLEVKANGPKRV